MSMDLARKTFSCEPEYFIAGTNIRIATAVKEAGADLSAHTPVLLAEGKVTPVAEAAKLTGLYGVTAEAAKSGEDAIIYLSGEFFADALVLPAGMAAADRTNRMIAIGRCQCPGHGKDHGAARHIRGGLLRLTSPCVCDMHRQSVRPASPWLSQSRRI